MYCNIVAALSEHQEMQRNKNKHISTNRISRRAGNELTMLSMLECCFFERCASSRPLKSRSCRVHLDASERVWLANDIVGMCLKQPLVLSDFFALIMYSRYLSVGNTLMRPCRRLLLLNSHGTFNWARNTFECLAVVRPSARIILMSVLSEHP
jgi:hypothetical protein